MSTHLLNRKINKPVDLIGRQLLFVSEQTGLLPGIFLYNVRTPETLLHTKLFVSPLRTNLVPRPRLIEWLD
jgi:hypothetical protein